MSKTRKSSRWSRAVALISVATAAVMLAGCTGGARTEGSSSVAVPYTPQLAGARAPGPTEVTSAMGSHISTAADPSSSTGLVGDPASHCPVASHTDRGAAPTLLGSGEDTWGATLFEFLAGGAADFGRDQSYGWVLSMLTGQKGDRSTPEKQGALDKQIGDIQATLDKVDAEIGDLKHSIDELDQLVVNTAYKSQYEAHQAAVNTALGHLTTDEQVYDQLVQDFQADPNYKMSNTQIISMEAMRATGSSNSLIDIINQIDTQMSTGGTSSMIQLMADITRTGLPWTGKLTETDAKGAPRFVSSDYVNPLYHQVQYYGDRVVRAYQLYAEVNHLAFGGPDGQADVSDPAAVTYESGCVQAIVDKWQKILDATSYGVPQLPDGTVVDTKNNLMWTSEPITPAGSASTLACGTGSPFCLTHQYAADGAITATSWQPDVKISHDNVTTLGGFDDWRLPTAGDFNTLQASGDSGIGDWGPAQGLGFLKPTNYTSFRDGAVFTGAEGVAPLLSYTTSFQVYSATNPFTDGSLQPMPAPADAPAAGGEVVVARPYTGPDSSPPSKPAPADESSSPGTLRTAKLTSAAPTQTFSTAANCGSTSYTVPDATVALKITAIGGAGGRSANNTITAGRGGTVVTTIPATPGTTLQIQVGGNGADRQGGTGGGGDGGNPAIADNPITAGGGGGGASAVGASCQSWLVVAGGGGGAAGTNAVQSGGNVGAAASQASGSGGDGGARYLPGQQDPQTGLGNVQGCGGSPGHSQPGAPTYTGGANSGGGGGINGKKAANAGDKGSRMKGGTGADGTPLPSPGAKLLGGAGGGGGAGFSGGGGGGGAGMGRCDGGGGAGGASYVIDTTNWLIAPETEYSISTANEQPSVTITPLTTFDPTTTTAYTFAKSGAQTTQLLEVNGGTHTEQGGIVDTWTGIPAGAKTSANHIWTFNRVLPTGAGLLQNKDSGMCLQVNGTDGTIDQWTCQRDSANHHWSLVPRPTGGTALQMVLTEQTGPWQPGTYYLATTDGSWNVTDGSPLTLMTDLIDDRTSWNTQQQK